MFPKIPGRSLSQEVLPGFPKRNLSNILCPGFQRMKKISGEEEGFGYFAKSIIVDVDTNQNENSNWTCARKFEFKLNGSLITTGFTGYDNGHYSTAGANAVFDYSLSKTGVETSGFMNGTPDNRMIAVFNSIINFNSIVFNNHHNSGNVHGYGFNAIKIWLSSDSITDITYGAAISNSTLIFDSDVSPHVASNVADDEILILI